MIRFSIRSRHRADTRASPADRPQSPPGTKVPFVARPTSATAPSVLVNYDTLPTRRPDGLALDYATYSPSRFHTPAPRSRRRARPTQEQAPVDALTDQARTLDLGLDLDSVKRNKAGPPVDFLQFVPIERRVRAKIAELRRLLVEAEHLGDIEVLKDLVGIHQANLANHRHTVHTITSQILEAKIIAGIVCNPPAVDVAPEPRTTLESRSTLIRKVSGKPMRHISGRTVSALKSRTASMRSNARGQKNASLNQAEPQRPQRGGNQPPGPTKGKDTPKISGKVVRKSSTRLRRLGSAGGVLIRRLSKVSVAEDASTGSSGEAPTSSTFNQETMKRLKACPDEVLAAYEEDLKQAQAAEEMESGKVNEARERLASRRSVHEKAMTILDQFYGSLPGWEDDPIASRMLPETAEMTEGGLEAERDLAEVRGFRTLAIAAYDDTGRGLKALHTVSSTMSQFIEDMEKILSTARDPEERFPGDKRAARIAFDDLPKILGGLENLLKKCSQNAEMAAVSCVDAPRVDQVNRDFGKLAEGFRQEAFAVMQQSGIFRDDFAPTLQVAKTGLCDCKLAETFIAERHKMIDEDLETMDGQVERCEEYVLMERMSLLDMYHPVREGK